MTRFKMRILSRLLARSARLWIVAALIALPVGGGAGVAVAAGGDSSAIAVNTKDGSSVFKLTFAIRKVTGSVVDNQNAAIAYSSCTACQTVAISIQVLLVSSDPTTFAPTNTAIAINQSCDLCDTLAAAYQFAVGVDTKLKFTAGGRQQIADIRRQLEQLRKSGLTGPAIDAKVNTLMNQLGSVLQNQLVGVNEPASGGTTVVPNQTGPPDTSPTTTTPTDTTTTPTTTSTTPTGTTSNPTSSTPAPTTDTTAAPAPTPTPTTTTP